MTLSDLSDYPGNPLPRLAATEGCTPPYRPVSAALAIAPTVSVIIPTRNEAANLPHVFDTLPGWVNEVIVVDGHSTDDTMAVARALRPDAKVFTQPGMGKGDALLAGFAAASGEILVAIDADGSTDGAEIVRLVGALVAGADFAKGSRFSGSGRSDDITAIRDADFAGILAVQCSHNLVVALAGIGADLLVEGQVAHAQPSAHLGGGAPKRTGLFGVHRPTPIDALMMSYFFSCRPTSNASHCVSTGVYSRCRRRATSRITRISRPSSCPSGVRMLNGGNVPWVATISFPG